MSHHNPSNIPIICPPWCRESHNDEVHLDDLRHQTEDLLLPVITRRRFRPSQDAPVEVRAELDELGVVIFQAFGEAETWVAIAGEFQSLEVSMESAERLHKALGGVLSIARGRTPVNPDCAAP